MKIAAAVLVLIATFVFVDGTFSKSSVGETTKPDFLELETTAPTKVESGDQEEVIEDWIDTVRRKRTRRQSRFC